ncbi:hypothetical protein PG995_001515 [Apiospora arundinis]|uniref:Integrase n=1 Tax=Apiospora arundinis TaxID=335852 RepID=A0ABR2J8F9_9PEZI
MAIHNDNNVAENQPRPTRIRQWEWRRGDILHIKHDSGQAQSRYAGHPIEERLRQALRVLY